MSPSPRTAVAMSGGVDSSVAAALLLEQGQEVFGLMLRLQDDGSGRANSCCAPDDVAAARSVAAALGFPFHVIDARVRFEEGVIAPFVRGYAQGLTPNPCIECNRIVRFGLLLDRASALGATHLATGHYARIQQSGALRLLLRARDRKKDQSYVLHMLTQRQLAATLFPLGDLSKDEVRNHARRLRLPVADRPESQDLCFVQGDYRAFLASRGLSAPPGPILDVRGNTIGTHTGLADFTLGQRKGLGIAGREAQYVIDKDMARNALIIGAREAAGRKDFSVTRLSWVAGAPPATEFDASVQVRYHAPRVDAHVACAAPGEARVHLGAREPDIAPGQSAVFYRDEVCLGGGSIRL